MRILLIMIIIAVIQAQHEINYQIPYGFDVSTLYQKRDSKGLRLGADYPTYLDYRNFNDRNIITPVKHQGQCGSCWVFAATAQYESLIMLYDKVSYDLSQQYTLQCESISNRLGCEGGFPQQALLLFNSTGVPLQQNFHYNYNENYNKEVGNPICTDPRRIKLSKRIISVSYMMNLDDKTIQNLLITRGPLSVGIDGSQKGIDGINSQTKVVNCQTNNVNHAVLLIGYNKTHWFIKNSWGTDWGDNGFAAVPKDNNCGISKQINAIIADWDTDLKDYSSQGQMKLFYQMTDKEGDGWNGAVVSLIQGNGQKGSIGEGFIQGYSTYYQSFMIDINYQVTIFLEKLGTKSQEIGFRIRYANGSNLFVHSPTQGLTEGYIFYSFCPSGFNDCKIKFIVILNDSFGDGWNGNVLTFKQGNTLIPFGKNFTRGRNDSFYVQFKNSELVRVFVAELGVDTNEVGFVVKDLYGKVVASRLPGRTFTKNTIITSFCPSKKCKNQFQTQVKVQAQGVVVQEEQNNLQKLSNQNPSDQIIDEQLIKNSNMRVDTNIKTDTNKNGIIALLAVLFALTAIVLVILAVKYRILYKKSQTTEIVTTENNTENAQKVNRVEGVTVFNQGYGEVTNNVHSSKNLALNTM